MFFLLQKALNLANLSSLLQLFCVYWWRQQKCLNSMQSSGKLLKMQQGCFATELTPSWKPFSIKLHHSTVHILSHWWGILGHFLIFENRNVKGGERSRWNEQELTMLKFRMCSFSLATLDFTCKIAELTLKCEVKTYIKPWYVSYLGENGG